MTASLDSQKRFPSWLRLLSALLIGVFLFPTLLFQEVSADESNEESSIESVNLTEYGLPVLYLSTDDGEFVTTRSTYKSGNFLLSDSESGQTGSYVDSPGHMQIKGRGNSTWWQFSTKKRSFTIKLDQKVNLLNLGSSKKWVLLANFMDRSNLRNKLAYDLSGALGMKYVPSAYVNLVFNGEYLGVYQLCRKINNDLLDIDDLEDLSEEVGQAIAEALNSTEEETLQIQEELKQDLSWLSTGIAHGCKINLDSLDIPSSARSIILELDEYYDEYSKFKSSLGVSVMVRSPEYLATNDELMSDLERTINEFEEALCSDDFTNSQGKHYSEYIDLDSFVNYFIVNSLFLNVEFGYKSMFCYLDDDGKLIMGPCWDYDWSSGNHFLGASTTYNQWYPDWRSVYNKWYQQLYGDPYFVALLRDRWFSVQDEIQSAIESIDSYYEYLSLSAQLEQNLYLADPDESDYRNQYHGYSFQEECESLKSFLENRAEWITEQLESRDPNISENGRSYGYRSSSSLKLSLTADNSLALCADESQASMDALVVEQEDAPGILTLSVECLEDTMESAVLFLNGKRVSSAGVIDQSVLFEFSSADLAEGVNILYITGLSQNKIVATSYLSLRTPVSEKETSSTETSVVQPGIVLPASIASTVRQEATSEFSKISVFLSGAILLAGGFISSLIILLENRKYRKKLHSFSHKTHSSA